MAKSNRPWFSFGWLTEWSWPERIIVLVLGLMPVATLAIVDRDETWLAGILAVVAFVALQFVVYRHGGWGLLGPHFFYDVVRLARRGRSTALRVAYVLALFIGLAVAYANTPVNRNWGPNESARVSEKFAFALFMTQNLAVLVLTPAYLGSAIAEEWEHRMLEVLMMRYLLNLEFISSEF